uniref:DUF202 domain-containing protein n=1 Tax=Paramoeba aestuarina TaxID=180227 RepID=A0A7S4KES1_9EUKA|mmetsp:Transcript_17990/g.28151  ORF Transcript_17990/g.28151 Transcript_17990/m.28151 type:complete len:137 (+) Transcript_17990:162-572(+)
METRARARPKGVVVTQEEMEGLVEPASTTVDPPIHWAMERTFIAWMRTSTKAITFGLVLIKVASVGGGEIVSAIMFILMGLVFFIGICIRFFFVYPIIERGLFYPNKMWPTVAAILCIGCTIVILIALYQDRQISK